MFDYDAAADLYFGQGNSRKRVSYRRFAHASAALKFAVEQLKPIAFSGSSLEVDEARFTSAEIRELYEHASFPLTRKADG